MLRFVARRTLFAIGVIWFVVTAVFVLFFAVPHDPARLIAGRQATPATVAAVAHNLWLDRPLPERYWHFLQSLLHGDLTSYRNNENVFRLIGNAVPVDISLAVGAAILWIVGGVGLGMVAARWPRRIADRISTITSLLFFSIPAFVVGLAFLYLLFYLPGIQGIHWFPPPGYVPLSKGVLPWAHALVLPWISLALSNIAIYSRLTRSSLLDVLGQEYIKTARAKGLSERTVVTKHAFRAALTPLVTQLGVDIATTFSGVILIEQVFGLNGLGRLAVQSLVGQDLPVIIGTAVVAAAFIVVLNLIVDILYAAVDPRITLS